MITGKSLSEALIFASTNPQYDNRLFIFHENCKLRIPAEHVVYTNCCFCLVLTFRTILVHNMFCGCCQLLKKICLYYILICIRAVRNGGIGPTYMDGALIIFSIIGKKPPSISTKRQKFIQQKSCKRTKRK